MKIVRLTVLFLLVTVLTGSEYNVPFAPGQACEVDTSINGSWTLWLNFGGTCTSSLYTVDDYDATTNPDGKEFVGGGSAAMNLFNDASCVSSTIISGTTDLESDADTTSGSSRLSFDGTSHELLDNSEGACFVLMKLDSEITGGTVTVLEATANTGGRSGLYIVEDGGDATSDDASVRWENAFANVGDADLITVGTAVGITFAWQTESGTDHRYLRLNTTESMDNTGSIGPVTYDSSEFLRLGIQSSADTGVYRIAVVACSNSYSDRTLLYDKVCGETTGCTGGQQGNYCN